MFTKQSLITLFENSGIALSDEQVSRLDSYAEQLVSYNQKVNLTALTSPRGYSRKALFGQYFAVLSF